MKAYFEKKLKRIDHSHKNTYEKLDNIQHLMRLDPKKIQEQAFEKAKKATVLFSKEYKLIFMEFHYFYFFI